MEKIFGVVIDNNLKSHNLIKANEKLSALARMSKLATPTQRKEIINPFVNAQFTFFL